MKRISIFVVAMFCIIYFCEAGDLTNKYSTNEDPKCKNKINLYYYDKVSKEYKIGCFDSIEELRNDPDKLPINYQTTGYSYFPLKIALPDYDLFIIQALQAGKCATFSADDVRACFLSAVNMWNSICPDRQIEIVALDDNAHVVVRASDNISDFTNPNSNKIITAKVTMSPRAHRINGVVTEVWWHRDEKSHQPKLLLNMTKEFQDAYRMIWTTECPCDAECEYTCISICHNLLHEIAHLYGVLHQDGCMLSDINYDEYAILHPDEKPCNVNSPRYSDVCNRELRNIDKCIFCKTLCPERCNTVVGIEVLQDDAELPSSFQVYPNPSNGIVVVKNISKLITSFSCTLYGSDGVKIVDCGSNIGSLNEISIDFNILGVCRGDYFLVIKNENDFSVRRIRIY